MPGGTAVLGAGGDFEIAGATGPLGGFASRPAPGAGAAAVAGNDVSAG